MEEAGWNALWIPAFAGMTIYGALAATVIPAKAGIQAYFAESSNVMIMSLSHEVLVAILKDRRDFEIARDRGWYRIPVTSADKWLQGRWPPEWIAFYQPKTFGDEAWSIRYYAQALGVDTVRRKDLLPEEEDNGRKYYRIRLGPLEKLRRPIPSDRQRYLVFIPTTWKKFREAREVNDLFDESPLEDLLWKEIQRWRIPCERQAFVKIKDRSYLLDFAFYCREGRIAVEVDGDTWHSRPNRIPLDNLRDNDLESDGWKLLRFNGRQVCRQMRDYCLPTLLELIERLNGIEDGRIVPRPMGWDRRTAYQLGLFDEGM